jgi:F420-dependent oxidoreductase-like protein
VIPQLHVFTNPQQGASYDDILGVARAAEQLGFDGFFRSDHFTAIGETTGLPGPTDAWLTLAGLARETRRIRLGTLVTPATYRRPGPLAVSVAQVDRMSGGRVELGFGAGWYESEHRAYGIPFPGQASRFDRFEEQLAVITGLWRTPKGKTFSYEGDHYRLVDAPAPGGPVQDPGPPLIIGGRGLRRTPRLAARYAAEYNLVFPTVEEIGPHRDRIDAACREIGRDPASIGVSSVALLVCGRDHSEVARRSDAGGLDVRGLLSRGLVGSPARVVDRIGQLAEAGVMRLYLQAPQQFDIDHLEYVAQHVLPQLRPARAATRTPVPGGISEYKIDI